jgi:hypothetical protein
MEARPGKVGQSVTRTTGGSTPGPAVPRYDRASLLSPEECNQVMDLWEVQRYGRDSFGDRLCAPLWDAAR